VLTSRCISGYAYLGQSTMRCVGFSASRIRADPMIASLAFVLRSLLSAVGAKVATIPCRLATDTESSIRAKNCVRSALFDRRT
jgi:hypothetical protein